MIDLAFLTQRPVVVAIAGSNGAGKTTFYRTQLASVGLRFVNADIIASELEIGPYEAARVAGATRQALADAGESFVFETVFSDPVGERMTFLQSCSAKGYNVVLIFIGIADETQSIARVAMRVAKGGHDVPDEKLRTRFSRTLANLKRAVEHLPHVLVFDNTNLSVPYRLVAVFDNGRLVQSPETLPEWLRVALS